MSEKTRAELKQMLANANHELEQALRENKELKDSLELNESAITRTVKERDGAKAECEQMERDMHGYINTIREQRAKLETMRAEMNEAQYDSAFWHGQYDHVCQMNVFQFILFKLNDGYIRSEK